jgi:hypothetical protein
VKGILTDVIIENCKVFPGFLLQSAIRTMSRYYGWKEEKFNSGCFVFTSIWFMNSYAVSSVFFWVKRWICDLYNAPWLMLSILLSYCLEKIPQHPSSSSNWRIIIKIGLTETAAFVPQVCILNNLGKSQSSITYYSVHSLSLPFPTKN